MMKFNMAFYPTVGLCVLLTLLTEVQLQDFQRFPMQIERIGHEVDWTDNTHPTGLNYTNTTFLLNDVIMQDGVLFAYSAYFLSNRPIRFQVWRPVNVFLRQFKLLWEHRIVPKEWHTRVETYISDLPNSSCFPVQNGDRLGVFIEEGPSSVSHIFDGNSPQALTHPLKRAESFAAVGEDVRFDALVFPYEYNVAAYLDTNLQRYQHGIYACPSYKPALRPKPTTAPEPQPKAPKLIPVGPPGPPGPIGPPGQGNHPNVVVHPAIVNNGAGSAGACSCGHETSLFNPTTLLVLVGWLTALTIINLCYICIMCCRCTTRTTYRSERQNTRNTLVENLRGGLAGGLAGSIASGLAQVTNKNDEIAFTKVEQEMTPSPLVNKAFDYDDYTQ